VLVDDRPELDQLLQRSYVRATDDGVPVRIAGDVAPAGAEAEAFAAFSRGDALETLAAARRSRSATPYLRYLCGTARWTLRELHGAAAEYEAAIALGPDPQLAATVRRQLEELEGELQPIAAAEGIARRNGWLAAVCAALMLGALWWSYRMSRMPAAPSVSVSTAAR